jgi:hypothetical protein
MQISKLENVSPYSLFQADGRMLTKPRFNDRLDSGKAKIMDSMVNDACLGGACEPRKVTVKDAQAQDVSMYSIYSISQHNAEPGWADADTTTFKSLKGTPEKFCCTPMPLANVEKCCFSTGVANYGLAIEKCWTEVLRDRELYGSVFAEEALMPLVDRFREFTNHMAWHGKQDDSIMGLLNNPLIPKITLPVALDEAIADREQLLMILTMALSQWGNGQFKSSGTANRIVMGQGLYAVLSSLMIDSVPVLDRFAQRNNLQTIKEPELDNIPTNCGGCSVSGMFLTRVPNVPSPMTAIQRKQPIRFGLLMPEVECDGTIRMQAMTRIASTSAPNPGDGLFILFGN